jgi:ribonuclease BN (tRNA processing enzyme)
MTFLVLTDDQALLLDAGTGVSRLIELPVQQLLEPYDELDIVLSHYHLDHVIGLSYMPAIWTRGRIRVFGPASPLVDAEPEAALNQLLSPPLFSARHQSFPAPVELIAIRQERFQAGGLAAQVWRQAHPGGSVGVRLGDDIAYLTDTGVEPANRERVQGVKLLLHELWATDAEAEQGGASGHSHFSAVAGFVKAAGVRSVMLVHHHPKRPNTEIRELTERMAEVTGVPVELPEEGRVYELA